MFGSVVEFLFESFDFGECSCKILYCFVIRNCDVGCGVRFFRCLDVMFMAHLRAHACLLHASFCNVVGGVTSYVGGIPRSTTFASGKGGQC